MQTIPTEAAGLPSERRPRPLCLERLEGRTPIASGRELHPVLEPVGRLLESLFTVSPAGARRLGLADPEAWAVLEGAGAAAPVVGLLWLAGETAGITTSPGRAADAAVLCLLDALVAAARRRRLTFLTVRLSTPTGHTVPVPPSSVRKLVKRDGTHVLYLHLTVTEGD
jgi:hypothetical protein